MADSKEEVVTKEEFIGSEQQCWDRDFRKMFLGLF